MINSIPCLTSTQSSQLIKLGHGSGGKMTSDLIEEVFLPTLGNSTLNTLDDSALVQVAQGPLAFTIDSYVVSPIFFPGGNIGSLAVNGTVNDLAVRGARPLFLSTSFILEEGLALDDLRRVITSLRAACDDSGINLVTADTKVVNKGAADQLFITTSGIGVVEYNPAPSAASVRPGDCIVISGDIGRHGIAIMSTREGLELETSIESDSCSLYELAAAALKCASDGVHCMRDITRGGLATVLNEIAASSQVGLKVDEEAIPVHPEVTGVCELLGLDPLYVACEGRLVMFVPGEIADLVLSSMRQCSAGAGSCVIGSVTTERPGSVILRSRIGGNRILDKLSGEQLPRIC
jgi:hydrogenase expression/formation protein HypE